MPISSKIDKPFVPKFAIIILCLVTIVLFCHMAYKRYELHMITNETKELVISAETASAEARYSDAAMSYLNVLQIYQLHYPPYDVKVLNLHDKVGELYIRARQKEEAFHILMAAYQNIAKITDKNRTVVASIALKLKLLLEAGVETQLTQAEKTHILELAKQARNRK